MAKAFSKPWILGKLNDELKHITKRTTENSNKKDKKPPSEMFGDRIIAHSGIRTQFLNVITISFFRTV
jgi:hypothetical protein